MDEKFKTRVIKRLKIFYFFENLIEPKYLEMERSKCMMTEKKI